MYIYINIYITPSPNFYVLTDRESSNKCNARYHRENQALNWGLKTGKFNSELKANSARQNHRREKNIF